MAGETKVTDAAESVLDAIVTHYAANNIALPDVQHVTMGEATADCESLVVEIASLFPGVPANEQRYNGQLEMPKNLQLFVNMFRCAPTPDAAGNPPTPAQQSDATRLIGMDGWHMLRAVWVATNDKALFIPPASGKLASIGSVTWPAPEGDLMQARLDLVVGF